MTDVSLQPTGALQPIPSKAPSAALARPRVRPVSRTERGRAMERVRGLRAQHFGTVFLVVPLLLLALLAAVAALV